MTTELNQQDTTGLAAAAGAVVTAAAAQLGEAIGAPVRLAPTTIATDAVPAPGVEDVFVEAALSGAVTGTMRLILDGTDAGAIVAAVNPGHSEDAPLDETALSALTEVLSRFMSGAATALGEGLDDPIDIAAPAVGLKQTGEFAAGTAVVTIAGEIGGVSDVQLFWLIEPTVAATISAGWGADTAGPVSAPPEASPAPTPVPSAPLPPVPGGGVIDTVELDIAVELGNVAMTIGELLHMGEGSVVTLTQAVGDKVIMLANGTAVASGEVVVVDGTLGFRVAELITEAPGA